MNIEQAREIANRWLEIFKPYTKRIEIAGSIRRCKPEVKDIELVCIPEIGLDQDLFGNPIPFNRLDRFVVESNFLTTKNGSRYKQIVTGENIKIDLFIVLPPSQWGVQLLLRTGSADYSHRFVTAKRYGGMLPSNMHVKDGAIWVNGNIAETPEEDDVYKLIGGEWLHPSERKA